MPTTPKNSRKTSTEEQKSAVIDVTRKIQEGQVPSNPEINAVIDTTSDVISKETEKSNIPPSGARAVEDLQNVLHSAQTLWNEKNRDEKLQRLISNVRKASESPSLYSSYKSVSKEVKGQQGKMEDVGDQFSDIYRNMSNFTYQMVRSKEFRNLILEFIQLSQTTARLKLEEKVREQDPSLLEKGKEGKSEKVHETKNLKDLAEEKKQEFREKKPTSSSWEEGEKKGFEKEGIQKKGFEKEGIQKKGFEKEYSPSEKKFENISEKKGFEKEGIQKKGFEKEYSPSEKKFEKGNVPTEKKISSEKSTLEKGMERKMEEIKRKDDRPLGDLISETGAQLKDLAIDVKDDIKEGNLPIDENERKRLHYDWELFLRKVANNKDFHYAMHGIFNIFDQISEQADRLKQKIERESEQVKRDQYLNQIWNDSKDLIGEFSGREKLDTFLNDLWNLWYHVREDPELNNYFNEIRVFMEETLKNPQKLEDDKHSEKSKYLVNKGQDIFEKWKYQEEMKQVLHEGQDVLDSIRLDETTQNFVDSTKKLAQDLIFDEKGRPSLQVTTEVLETLRSTLVPAVLKNLANIPIPKIEGSNEDYDYSFDNVIFNAFDLLPENVYFVMNSGVHLELKKRNPEDTASAEILLRVADFSVNLENFDFYFARKTFPKIEDAGTAKASLGGKTRISVIWRVMTEFGRPTQVSLAYVDCTLDKFNVKILHSEKHEWLLKFITTVFSGLIAKRIEKVVEEKMKEGLLQFNQQMNDTLRDWDKKSKEVIQKGLETIAEK